MDTAYTSRGEAEPLLRVEELDLPGRRVRLSDEPAPGVGRRPELHPFLRRWDHHESTRRTKDSSRTGGLRHGALRVEEGRWLPLEDGVEVYFAAGGTYRTGDFWLIPARTATGGVEWPTDPARRPLLQAPAGIEVHYAPLAWVQGEQAAPDLRLAFRPLSAGIPAADEAALAAEAEARAEETDGAPDGDRGRGPRGGQVPDDRRGRGGGGRGRCGLMATPLTATRLLKALRDEGLVVHEVRNWRTHNRNSKGPWGPVNGVMIHHTVTKGTAGSVDLCYDGHAEPAGPAVPRRDRQEGRDPPRRQRPRQPRGARRPRRPAGSDQRVRTAATTTPPTPTATATSTASSASTSATARTRGRRRRRLAIEKVSAAICRAHDWTERSVIGHKEWQPGKVDPRGFTMDSMRGRIKKRLAKAAEGTAEPGGEGADTGRLADAAEAAAPAVRAVPRQRLLPRGRAQRGDHGHGQAAGRGGLRSLQERPQP